MKNRIGFIILYVCFMILVLFTMLFAMFSPYIDAFLTSLMGAPK